MKNINSYEDICQIDAELAKLFLRPDEALRWVNTIESSIKEWVNTKNKQYWEVVRFVSERRGILGKLANDKNSINLSRIDFAKVLLKFCPLALRDGERINTLQTSMAHYPNIKQLKECDKTYSKTLAKIDVEAVEAIFDGAPIEKTAEPVKPAKPTLEKIVEDYLRAYVDEKCTKWPRSIVCVRPQYDDVCPALSVETFHSEKFRNEHRPSHIDAYEFEDGVLSKDRLHILCSKYSKIRGVKLFVVSKAGLLPDVRSLALDRNIGYIRLNPNKIMSSDNFELPRSIEDYTKQLYDLDIIMGKKTLSTPLLIMDGSKVTPSLADVLTGHGVVIKKSRQLNIPYLSDEEIEKKVNALIGNDVLAKKNLLHKNSIWTVETPSDVFKYATFQRLKFSIDPFSYTESLGLSYNIEDLNDDSQLGRFDVKRKHITLNSRGMDNKNRFRFTMAHELGHFLLQAPLFQQQGIVSVGESETTLSLGKNESRRVEIQANKFASYLLMPKDIVEALYVIYFDKYVRQKYGGDFRPFYYSSNQKETWDNYKNIVVRMANKLCVSIEAMEHRLTAMKLLKKG